MVKIKLSFIKERFEKSIRESQESSEKKQNHIKDLKETICRLETSVEQNNKLKKSIAVDAGLETKVNDQAIHIDKLEIENKCMKQKNIDINDELGAKNKELEDIKATISLKSSQKSLQEELLEFRMIECDECRILFSTDLELKQHLTTSHVIFTKLRTDVSSKQSALEKELSEQKVALVSSVFQLKAKETEENKICFNKKYCKKYCRINHSRHNFVKSISDEIFSKLNNLSESPNTSPQTENPGFGAMRKQSSCNKCDEVFPKQGFLKKHKKLKHKREEKGEVEEYKQTGEMK